MVAEAGAVVTVVRLNHEGAAKLYVPEHGGRRSLFIDDVDPSALGFASPETAAPTAAPRPPGADRPDPDDDGRVGDWPPRLRRRGGVANSAAVAADLAARREKLRGLRIPASAVTDPFGVAECNATDHPYRNREVRGCAEGHFLNHTALCGHPPVMLLVKKSRRKIAHRRTAFGRSLFHADSYHPYIRPIERDSYVQALRHAARDIPGMVVSVLDGTGVPESVSEPPVVDSHGGAHNIFQPWVLSHNHSAAGEGAKWQVRFWRSYSTAAQRRSDPQSLPAQRDVYAIGVPNVWARDGNLYSCKWGFSPGGCEWEFEAEDSARWTVGRAVVLCTSECGGYFHFTHDHLPRVALLYDEIIADPSLNVLVPSLSARKAPFIAQYLHEVHLSRAGSQPHQYLHEVLGIPYKQLIASDAKVRSWPRPWNTVFVQWALLPQPSLCGKTQAYPLFLLRSIVFKRLGLQHERPREAEGPFRVLFAERRSSRMAANWAEVVQRLSVEFSSTIAISRTLNTSVLEQVKAFNAADMVIGPHGANLANIMWMRHGTTVLELASYNYGNMCYYSTSARLGLLHRFILHDGLKNGTYVVDADEVSRHLRDAMRRASGEEALRFY